MSAQLSNAAAIKPPFTEAAQQRAAATLGLWVFLGTELLFFAPLFFGYLYGRTHFPNAFAQASRHTDVVLGTLNTALLLTSSLTMVLAIEARKISAQRVAATWLWITCLFGVAFLAVKGVEYVQDWQEHLIPGPAFALHDPHDATQLFFVLYFAMTALHALHLLIGIVMLMVFAIALSRRSHDFADAGRLELAGLYWHFVDVIWIFLYPLLYLVGRRL